MALMLQSLLSKERHDVTLALCLGLACLALGDIDRWFFGRRFIFGERLPRRLFPSYYIELVHVLSFQRGCADLRTLLRP